MVDILDINAISSDWSLAPSAAVTPVPEPSTWALLVAALCSLAMWRGRAARR